MKKIFLFIPLLLFACGPQHPTTAKIIKTEKDPTLLGCSDYITTFKTKEGYVSSSCGYFGEVNSEVSGCYTIAPAISEFKASPCN